MATKHFKKTAANRQGYFMKGKPNPTPNYESKWKAMGTPRGFMGGYRQVHHAVPQVSIDEATSQISDADKSKYVKNVKWVTPWNINEDPNLIGLPTAWSYMQAAERVTRLAETKAGLAKLTAYAKMVNDNMSLKVRSEALARFENGFSPARYPIHNPTSWGHVEYNKKVATDVHDEVFDPLKEKLKKHQENPEQVEALMNKLSKRWLKKLQNKQGATVAKWMIKNRTGTKKWYTPFLMADVKKSPLG